MRTLLLVVALLFSAAATALAALAINAASGSPVDWLPTMNQHPLRWLAGTVPLVAVAALFLLWAQRLRDSGLRELIPAAYQPESWAVDRPGEVDAIVRGLGTASTVGVVGGGGFGKSTVARIAGADRRVLRRYGRRVYWVVLGRDARRGALVGKVNDLVARIDPAQARTFTDLRQAAEFLRAVLANGPRRLIVLDDVWFEDQLEAFPVAGRSARLVTTRIPTLIGDGESVRLDRMDEKQARAVLTAGLPPLPEADMIGLVAESGRWPLLLRLINKVLADQGRVRADVSAVAAGLLDRLRERGSLQVDALTGAATRHLDADDPGQRRHAVSTTIEAGAGLLDPGERDRLAELAIFIEDESVPLTLIEALWLRTSGYDAVAAGALCARFDELALLTTEPGDSVRMHDVLRELLREDLGPDRIRDLHDDLLQAVRAGAWWELPASARYLWDHLIEHLVAAGRRDEADATVTDLRWIAARLERSGQNGPLADLTEVGTERSARLARFFGQIAHLLEPTWPEHSRVDVLVSRVAHDPDWGQGATALAAGRAQPALVNRWPLPALPHPALRRLLAGHTSMITSMAVSPRGDRLATGGYEGTVRVWDVASGRQLTQMTAENDRVETLAIAPDGTWLAAAGIGSVRIWDLATGTQRTRLRIHTGQIRTLDIAPDGTWLAAVGVDGSVRVGDVATGRRRFRRTVRPRSIRALAIGPDGTWLATGTDDGAVQMWDARTGEQRDEFAGHQDRIEALKVAPDGSWIAVGGSTVRIWDLGTGEPRSELDTGLGSVHAMAVTPGGSLLATADSRTLRVWDTANGEMRAELTTSDDRILAVALAPDGAWAATGGYSEVARIWDLDAALPAAEPSHRADRVRAVAGAPDGSWLVSCGKDSVRIWDAATGLLRAEPSGADNILTVAAAPSGNWFATGGEDGTVRLWDVASGQQRTVFPSPARLLDSVYTIAVAPDGTWVAAAGQYGSVRVWEVGTGRLLSRTESRSIATSIAVLRDGRRVVLSARDGTVRVIDSATGRRLRRLRPNGLALSVAVAPDGGWVAAGGRKSVRLWNPVTGRRLGELTGHTGMVRAVAIAPDDRWIAVGGHDGSVRIWDRAAGRPAAMTRVEGAVTALVWSPCGRWLTVAGEAGLHGYGFRDGAAGPPFELGEQASRER